MTEKVYISRDESSDFIWVWRKPGKGIWSPSNIGGTEYVNWQRPDRSLEQTSYYLCTDFKKKFGTTIKMKTKKCVHLPVSLLDSEDYKMSSMDPNRKR